MVAADVVLSQHAIVNGTAVTAADETIKLSLLAAVNRRAILGLADFNA
jgi:hypothetical protein